MHGSDAGGRFGEFRGGSIAPLDKHAIETEFGRTFNIMDAIADEDDSFVGNVAVGE